MNTRKKDDYPDSRYVKEQADEYPNECRHCNSSKTKVGQVWISNEIGYHYFVVCEECLMRGPMKISRSSATDDWNSLPRRNKTIDEASQRILAIETALNGIAGSLKETVLLLARNIDKLAVIETVVLKQAGHYPGKVEP
jgi:hypothetical protein